jgi:hypothetical protein
MPTTIEQTPGGLYKQPDRTVATFPSGLVRIDQSYMCRNSAEATHRETLAVGNELPEDDGYPAIDGAYIFPHCQQVRRGTGFTEFIASAYGRTTDQPTNFITSIQTVASGQTSSYKLLNFTVDIVLPTGEAMTLDALNLDPLLLDPFDYFYLNQYNTVKYITVTESILTGQVAVNAEGQLSEGLYRRKRNFLVTFDIFTSSGNPTGTTQDALFVLNDPTIKVVSQTHFGKFTEYKVDVNHNITTSKTTGEAGPPVPIV